MKKGNGTIIGISIKQAKKPISNLPGSPPYLLDGLER